MKGPRGSGTRKTGGRRKKDVVEKKSAKPEWVQEIRDSIGLALRVINVITERKPIKAGTYQQRRSSDKR